MKKLLNDGWEFLKLPAGSIYEEAMTAETWEAVDLPHDWLIRQHDLYETADAWYRRTLEYDEIPEACLLYFDGVYMDCDVLLNGKTVCSHAYGYTAFTADLTRGLRKGANQINVHIRHRSPNTRWYSGSGIYRDVYLLELPENHIVPDSFYLKEKKNEKGWELRIAAETSCNESGVFRCAVTDAAGHEMVREETASQAGQIKLTVHLNGAEAWDPEHPVLYFMNYEFGSENGKIRFGLRTTEFSPDRGFILNGKVLKLKGVCLHHDLGALGAAFHEKAARRQLMLMKEMGANALRTSHNPPASKLLDLCDELGILVNDEAFDMWERPKTEYDYSRFFPSCEKNDVAAWIRRDRIHPSVVMWSVGNEIYDMHADLRGTEVCRMLMNQVRSHDPDAHAAVTFGCNYMPWEGGQRCADLVKIAGYNYGERLYEKHHREHPDWVIYGSETASVLSSRGIYHFPIEKSIMSEADLQCSALGNSNTSWGAENLRKMITDDLKCSFSMGQFIWSGIDYIGEPTPYHTRSCYFGQADTACYPKDAYYLFRSLWSDRKTLHIGVTWDWNPGQMIDVPVMTNYPRIELLVNGRSCGIQEVSGDDADRCVPVWKIPFEPGELRARALDVEGNILQEDVRRTSGDTARLVLTAEDSFLRGDGHDMLFVTVQAEDCDGNPVENARDRIRIYISGGAYLIGTDNGDSTDMDGYKQNSRRLFGGKLLIMAASDGSDRDALIAVESTEGIRSEIRIPVVTAERIPGTSCVQRIPDLPGDSRIPVRKIEILAEGTREMSGKCPSYSFRVRQLPEKAQGQPLVCQVTNDAGIAFPFAKAEMEGNRIRVTAEGDGKFQLRVLGGNAEDHPEIISQIGVSAEGIGNPPMNPYEFVSAGLYDIHDGDIGSGNEKGIAFSREGASMVGFSRVDFGRTGSDLLVLPVFALDDCVYEIELFDGIPDHGGRLIDVLRYSKPSIWNVYQEEKYCLPERLKDIHCLCFRMKEKVHLKGFRFEQRSRAFDRIRAGTADMIYGDAFCRDGDTVRKIGNNVSLCFGDMDFGGTKECGLVLRGSTKLQVNTVTVLFRNEKGKETTSAVDFLGRGGSEQYFRVYTPGGCCTVTFVFLPGSSFDFESFRFYPSGFDRTILTETGK